VSVLWRIKAPDATIPEVTLGFWVIKILATTLGDFWGLAFGSAAEWTASKWCGTLMEHARRILIWPLSIRRRQTMIRTFSFAAALLIALSSLAFAGTGSPGNGAYPKTHKHHSQSDHSTSGTSGNGYEY
jgi:hypothetical protein